MSASCFLTCRWRHAFSCRSCLKARGNHSHMRPFIRRKVVSNLKVLGHSGSSSAHFGCVSTARVSSPRDPAVSVGQHAQREFSSISSSESRFFHFESDCSQQKHARRDDCRWCACACAKMCFTSICRFRNVLKRNRHHYVRLAQFNSINFSAASTN